MRHILAMTLAVLLSAGAAGAQDFDAGLEAYQRGDYASAMKEWHPLAEAGNPHIQFFIGGMYDLGQGVPQDNGEAVHWYRLSANQGIAKAQVSLGNMYYYGEGVSKDFVEAHKRFNMGCALGEQLGCDNRNFVSSILPPADISEAQRRARVCMESNFRDCD